MTSSTSTPQILTRLGGDALSAPHHLVAPAGSTSDRNILMVDNVSVEGDTSLAKKGYRTTSSSTQNEAQTMRQPAKRPHLRRIGRRLPARTFPGPPPARQRKFKILSPSPAPVPSGYGAASPMAPSLKPKPTPTEPPLAYRFRNGGAYRGDGEETRSIMRVRTT